MAKILILSKEGSVLAQCTVGNFQSDDEINFSRVLTILEPIASNDSSFLFTMRIGPYQIDVAFSFDTYAFSIINATQKSDTSNINSIFSQILVDEARELISFNKQDIKSFLSNQLQQEIPINYIERITNILNKFIFRGVNYVAFIAQNHRIVYTLGETKLPPDEFIFAWCAALEQCNNFSEENSYIQVQNQSIIIVPIYPSLKAIVFFDNSFNETLISSFISTAGLIKQDLKQIFQPEIKVQMPKQPSTSRRPGFKKPN